MKEGGKKGAASKKPQKNQYFRPNLRRQALYVAVTLVGVFGGYFAVTWVKHGLSPLDIVKGTKIKESGGALFPDAVNGNLSSPQLAYEEALPEEIYQPPVVSLPIPPPPRREIEAPPEPAARPPEVLEEEKPEATLPAPELAPKPATEPEIKPAIQPEKTVVIQPKEPSLPSWRRFAAAFKPASGRPRIAIVIDDMGVDRARTEKIIGIKAPLTLSFLSYASGLPSQTMAASKAGHELLLHVAMEPAGKGVDSGPNTLLTSHSEEELLRLFRWGLSRFDSYVGVNNHMGSKFTANENAMKVIMREIKDRGLLFLDSRTSGSSVGARLAKDMGVPFAVRNIFLDNDNDEAAVYARLAEAEKLARAHGFAIAIGHPRDATINILPKWIAEAEELGFVLAPLSSLIADHDG